MSYFDYQLSRDLAQGRVTGVRRGSEWRYRLYWATVARQISAPRRSDRAWSRTYGWLRELWRWWPERVASNAQAGEEGAQTRQLIADKG